MSRETPPGVFRGRTANCTARAARPTTHFYICCQLSSIRCSGFASGLSNDFSPPAQTLVANAPSLVPFQGAALVKWPSEIPTLFQYVKPTIWGRGVSGIELRIRFMAGATFGLRCSIASAYLPDTFIDNITLYKSSPKGLYSAAGLPPAVTRLSYPKTSPFPVSASQSRFPLVTLRHFWFMTTVAVVTDDSFIRVRRISLRAKTW